MSATPSAGQLLREVLRLYARAQRGVAGCCETTNSQCHILTELARSGPITLNELGKRLQLEKSWISRAVDKLVEQGMLGKQANPADARSWIVELTGSGKQHAEALNASLDAHAENLLASLRGPEHLEVAQALALLRKTLGEETRLETPSCTQGKCR